MLSYRNILLEGTVVTNEEFKILYGDKSKSEPEGVIHAQKLLIEEERKGVTVDDARSYFFDLPPSGQLWGKDCVSEGAWALMEEYKARQNKEIEGLRNKISSECMTGIKLDAEKCTITASYGDSGNPMTRERMDRMERSVNPSHRALSEDEIEKVRIEMGLEKGVSYLSPAALPGKYAYQRKMDYGTETVTFQTHEELMAWIKREEK